MTNGTQLKWVKDRLIQDGYVSRNDAVRNYITRLGALVLKLNKTGQWDVQGEYVIKDNGKDYVYRAVKKPFVPQYRYDPARNVMVQLNFDPEAKKDQYYQP